MRIYAIRDRLIDYFMAPFAAPGDKEVLAAMAHRINLVGETNDAIAQAPHHFEIWKLGEVNEDGHITAAQDFIADCSSLIRRGIRSAEERTTGSDGLKGPENERTSRANGDREGAGTDPKANGHAAETAPQSPESAHRQPGGGDKQPSR